MLVVADVIEDRRHPVSDEDKELFGIDILNAIRSEIPAVTHVDMSARIQTVHKETNPRYHALLSAFRCFMGTDIDLLVAGNCVARKEDQNASRRVD